MLIMAAAIKHKTDGAEEETVAPQRKGLAPHRPCRHLDQPRGELHVRKQGSFRRQLLPDQPGQDRHRQRRLLGLGPGNSQQRNFLPQAYNDFIYSIIIEEYGLIGGAFIIFVSTSRFLYRCIRLYKRCPYAFGAFLALGLSASRWCCRRWPIWL
jgi:cell division protein FtsW